MDRLMSWFYGRGGTSEGDDGDANVAYTVALRDDYEWWGKECHESDESGKLLLVDTADTDVIQVQ